MKKSTLIFTFLAFDVGLSALALNRAASFATAMQQQGIHIEYATGSPASGQAFISVDNDWKPVWTQLEWQWCPQLNPLRWCLEFEGDTAEGKGIVSTNGSQLFVRDLVATTQPLEMVFSGFVTTEAVIEANIRSAVLGQKPMLKAIEAIDAVLLVSEVEAMGFEFDNHRLSAKRDSAADFDITIEGSEANGAVTSSANGDYNVRLNLTPAPAIASMISGGLPKNPDGSFRFEESGTLPMVN